MLINGEAVAWADVKVEILGRVVVGITALKWGNKQEKTNNYGSGVDPISRGRGKKEPEASVTLEMAEIIAIEELLDEGEDLMDIPFFDITVSFENKAGMVATYIIEDAEFTQNIKDIKTGDTTIEVELPLIISGVKKAA